MYNKYMWVMEVLAPLTIKTVNYIMVERFTEETTTSTSQN